MFYHVYNESVSEELKKKLDFVNPIEIETIRVYVPDLGHFDYEPLESELIEVFDFDWLWSFITFQAFSRAKLNDEIVPLITI